MADDLTLAIKLAMDNSSFQQGIQNLKREMEVVQSQFRESTAGMKDWGKNLDGLKNYADALTQKLELQRKVVQAYQEQLNKSKQSLDDNAKKMLELKEKVGQAEQAWKNAEKTLGKNAEETQKLKAEYEKLKKEYEQQEQKVRNNQKAVEGYTIQLNNAQATLNKMEVELKETTAEINKQSNAWLKLSDKAKEVGEKLKSVGDKMASVGKDLSMKLTAPIVGAGAAAVKFASDLNESINKVDVAFKNNVNEVKKWSDTTLQKFGIAKGTALDMAASFGDMATSMGLNTQQAAQMSMKLVGLAGDLASFKNISIDVANTALTSVFTGETESLKQLGVVMTEANLQEFAYSKGINKRIQDMSEAEKVQLRYNFVLEKTKNAQGDFERTGAGAANQMRIFQESLKQLAETFGQQLLPIITPMIAKLNEMIQKFAGLDEHTKKIIIVFAGVVAAIGPLLLFIGNLISAVGTISTAFGALTGAMATAGGASAVLGSAFTALTGPVGIAILAITGIIAAGVLLIKNWDKIKESLNNLKENIASKFNSIKENISNAWENVKSKTSNVWNNIKNTINEHAGGIKGIIGTYIEGYKAVWSKGFEFLNSVTGRKLGEVFEKIKSIANSIKEKLSDMFDFKIPKIKLPHFNITGKFSLNPPSVPHLNVNWYASGGIFNRPSIIGVGEAGTEAVLPIDRLDELMARAIEKAKGGSGSGLTLHIENFINNSDKDIEQLAYELEFYRQRVSMGRGGY